ncbi:MAG TPA: MerR family transcriptional regulator [Gemmatimonadales bacterium]|nr:MerR family transcriptional regulator [Gemmatimonadales bacterium]
MSEQAYFTIAQLARRLGVTLSSVRHWIGRGLIEEPAAHPGTHDRVFSAMAVNGIEMWYLRRCISGRTRGPGSRERKQAAQERLFGI